MIISREEYEKLNSLVDAQRELINALKKQITFLEAQIQLLNDLNQLIKKQNQILKDTQFGEKGANENPLEGIEPKSIPTEKHTFKYQEITK